MDSAQDLLRIIDDVLDFSRTENGSLGLAIEDVDLGTLLAECVAVTRPLVSGRDLVVEAVGPEMTVVVRTDRLRLKQILINLLGNAVKFTGKGRIETRLDPPSGQEARILVKDTGIGIPEADMERIFEEFYQVEDGTARTYQGTGMGLALVRHLTMILGGRIEVESVLGEGSTFIVCLPIAKGGGE